MIRATKVSMKTFKKNIYFCELPLLIKRGKDTIFKNFKNLYFSNLKRETKRTRKEILFPQKIPDFLISPNSLL